MKKRLILGAVLATAFSVPAAVVVATAANAADHFKTDVTFPVNVCGYDAMDHLRVIDNFGFQKDGLSWDSGQIDETFTFGDGRAVSTHYTGHLQNLPAIQNADGTTTYPTRYSGAQMTTKVVNGPVLQQNAGQLDALLTVDADGNFVDFTIVVKAGPNPNTTGLIDCSVVASYLAGN
jgi:hypothetical protein